MGGAVVNDISTQRRLRGGWGMRYDDRQEVQRMNAEETGALIRRLRRERGLTQAQLAGMLQVSDKAVSKWERGVSQS